MLSLLLSCLHSQVRMYSADEENILKTQGRGLEMQEIMAEKRAKVMEGV